MLCMINHFLQRPKDPVWKTTTTWDLGHFGAPFEDLDIWLFSNRHSHERVILGQQSRAPERLFWAGSLVSLVPGWMNRNDGFRLPMIRRSKSRKLFLGPKIFLCTRRPIARTTVNKCAPVSSLRVSITCVVSGQSWMDNTVSFGCMSKQTPKPPKPGNYIIIYRDDLPLD